MVQVFNWWRILFGFVLWLEILFYCTNVNLLTISRLTVTLTTERGGGENDGYVYFSDDAGSYASLNETIDSVKQHYLQYLESLGPSSSYVPQGHTTRFVPLINYSDYYYTSVEEMLQRNQRFPSVSDRVKLYMSNWYKPPCSTNIDGHIQYVYVSRGYPSSTLKTTVLLQPSFSSSIISTDTTYSRGRNFFLYERNVIAEQCNDRLCLDAQKYFIPYVDSFYEILNDRNDTVPLLLQHGDNKWSCAKVISPIVTTNETEQLYQCRPNVPIMKKFRTSFSKNDILSVWAQDRSECYTNERDRWIPSVTSKDIENDPTIVIDPLLRPIVSIISNFGRHFNPLNDVIYADRLSWDQKISQAIFRGGYTGTPDQAFAIRANHPVSYDYERCQRTPRCRLVYNSYNSSLVDAKLTFSKRRLNETLIDGIPMTGPSLSMDELLQYKGLILVEGNDVASGLKWALFSKSVVFMPAPHYTSWAMEELLVPWIHYIPLNEDLSDVEEKVQWMLDHDAEARAIADRGHLWMTDMMFHPRSMQDHEEILQETMRRYRAHFRYVPTLVP